MFGDLLCGLFLSRFGRCWFFFLAHSVHFEKLRSIGWFHFIYSFIRTKELCFSFHFWFHTFVCNGVNQWMELYSFGFKYWSTLKKRSSKWERETAKKKDAKKKEAANNQVSIYLIGIESSHPQVWNASSTAHIQTDRHRLKHSYNCDCELGHFYFSFSSMAESYLEWNIMLGLVRTFMHTRLFCHLERVNTHIRNLLRMCMCVCVWNESQWICGIVVPFPFRYTVKKERCQWEPWLLYFESSSIKLSCISYSRCQFAVNDETSRAFIHIRIRTHIHLQCTDDDDVGERDGTIHFARWSVMLNLARRPQQQQQQQQKQQQK